jgi:hypothetical protein
VSSIAKLIRCCPITSARRLSHILSKVASMLRTIYQKYLASLDHDKDKDISNMQKRYIKQNEKANGEIEHNN